MKNLHELMSLISVRILQFKTQKIPQGKIRCGNRALIFNGISDLLMYRPHILVYCKPLWGVTLPLGQSIHMEIYIRALTEM